MGRKQIMTAAGATLAGLGVLVGLAIGSTGNGPKLAAQRAQPVEVRTEVIRKTVNVYRRAKPHHVAAAGAGGRSTGAGSSPAYLGAATATTRTSPGHSGSSPAASAPVVSTRTSGSRTSSGSSAPEGSGSTKVKTRTSGGASSGGSSGGARPVSSRTSGGGDNGGGHDD
jgi:hypothetical protein